MSAKIIDGKALSLLMRKELLVKAEDFEKKAGRKVGLAVVLVGENPASQVYVRNKIVACEQTGIKSFAYYLPAQTTQEQLIQLIDTLNDDGAVDGILVQLPLPEQINTETALARISPDKDVDGFHDVSAGRLLLGKDCLSACTPSGIMQLLKYANVEIESKRAVVIGRSNIVGKPIALMLLSANATVTIAHSKTRNLKEICKEADILVVAIGKKEFVTADMVKKGAVVIDVGMNRADKLYGDVHFESVSKVASAITPVPGGVGPMTITMLMHNAVKAACKKIDG